MCVYSVYAAALALVELDVLTGEVQVKQSEMVYGALLLAFCIVCCVVLFVCVVD